MSLYCNFGHGEKSNDLSRKIPALKETVIYEGQIDIT